MINESIENEVAQIQEEEVAPMQEESSEAINMRAMRELKNKAERERDEFAREGNELKRRLQAYERPAESEYEDNSNDKFAIDEDDFVEGRHLKQVTKEMKKLKKEVQDYKYNTSADSARARLQADCPDFNSVVTKENIELLKISYPELAHTLDTGTDIYSTGYSAYTIMKKMGIYKPDPHKENRELAKRNASSPRSSASVAPQAGANPMTRVNAYSTGLTDEMKNNIYKNALKYSENY